MRPASQVHEPVRLGGRRLGLVAVAHQDAARPHAFVQISVLAPDLFDPSTYDVILSSDAAFAEVLNFRNIDAASVVGLLGQVTGWLDEFRRSDAFGSFDVPVLGTVLDDVPGFVDRRRRRRGADARDGAVTRLACAPVCH